MELYFRLRNPVSCKKFYRPLRSWYLANPHGDFSLGVVELEYRTLASR